MKAGSLFGRTRELELLATAINDTRAGRGGALLVSGEPGIGKTRLCEEAALQARAIGMLAVWGRAWEGGGAPPFWPWIQIARGLSKFGGSPPGELARLLPELGTRDVPPLATDADRFVLFDAMLRFVREMAARTPLLILFEDLHAADVASVQLLAFVAPELREDRALLLGTFRDAEARLQPDLAAALAAIGRAGGALRLQRLGREEIAALARERLDLDDAELDSLYEKTEGNPLFALETIRLLVLEGRRPDGSLPLSDGVRAAIRAHLGRVPALLRRDLDVAAVIGRDFAATVLAALVETSAAELVARLSEAAALGFLIERLPSRFAFAHGLFREVLLADLGHRAAPIHESAARLLETLHAGDPTALAEIARHWLAAGPACAARAREAARCAAEAAAAALAYAEAADLFERALAAQQQATPGDARGRAECWLAIGDARIRAGESRRGKEACERAAEIARSLGDTELLVRAALGHGSDFIAGARDRALAALLEEALAAAGSRMDLRARLLARRAAALQPARDPRGPIQMAREAIGLLREVDDPATRLAVLHNSSGAMVDFADPREREVIDEEVALLALRLGERAVHLRALGRLYHDHSERGDLVGAERRLDHYEQAATHWQAPHVRLPALLGRSCLALLRVGGPESTELVRQAQTIALRTGDPWHALAVAMHEIAALRIRGEADQLVRRQDEFRARIAVFPDYPAGFDAMVAARRGDPDSARNSLERLDREHIRLCMDTMLPTWVAEAAVAIRDPSWGEIAEEVLAPLAEEWISWSGIAFIVEAPVARARALAAQARGDQAAARRFFEQALAEACLAGAAFILPRIEREAAALPATRVSGGSAPAASQPAAPTDVTMTAEGEYWTVSGFGGSVRIKDSRGLQMLALLLAAPRREHHVLELSGSGRLGAPIDAGDAGELLDRQARDSYRSRLQELGEARADAEARADQSRLERVNAELAALEAELARGVGLGGRPRRASHSTERARVNVQRRLAEAIRRIERARAPLGAHLRKAVRTGTFCSYSPERAGRPGSSGVSG